MSQHPESPTAADALRAERHAPSAGVHRLFEAQAARSPGAVAVETGAARWTYAELNAHADSLAARLRAQGVGPETLVGVCAGRSLDLVAALLGVHKAGAAYLPLEAAGPPERRRFILDDARPAALLAPRALAGAFADCATRVICLEDSAEAVPAAAPDPLKPHASHLPQPASPPAYLLYTSGSTGRPKGVLIEHAALLNHARAIVARYALTPADRVLQFASIGFDVAAEEIFPTLAAGATVVLRPAEDFASFPEFHRFITRERITVLNLSASFWQGWGEDLARTRTPLPDALRLVIAGNEPVSPAAYARWREMAGGRVRWLNAYGPTEATITATLFEPEAGVDYSARPRLPIGRPMDHVEALVLDEKLREAPAGEPGELCLGGAGLARGYWNQPGLTAEKFIASPPGLERRVSGRLYRTGDRARLLPDGNLEFLGRLDEQAKIRGFRVEPAEVEAALARHPGVKECAVAVRENAGGPCLVAWLAEREPRDAVELWPCPGDYRIYDEVMYHAMTRDEERNKFYRLAIRQLVNGKVVVDVGTGQDALWAIECARAGARKVFAIEALEEPFRRARVLIERLGLSDRVIAIHGDSMQVRLPEPADVCVSELIGTIGNSEGAAAILSDARRFLKPGGVMIPSRCYTRIAAVTLPAELATAPAFSELGGHYARAIFDKTGARFDLRVAIKNFPHSHLLTDPAVFEDLDFSGSLKSEFERNITLRVTHAGRVDGFLLWLNLITFESATIDNLAHLCAWLPVYLPVFDPPVAAQEGDTITMTCRSRLSRDGVNPDYFLEGQLRKASGERVDFSHQSLLYPGKFRSHPFYAKLFAQEPVAVRAEADGDLSAQALRRHLRTLVPDYMVPAAFVRLHALPRLPGGKVDKHALPAPAPVPDAARTADAGEAPRTPTEQALAGFWCEVLGLARAGRQEDFFELGGHSLQATQVLSRVQQSLGVALPLRALFAAPTIAGLARAIDNARQGGEEVPPWTRDADGQPPAPSFGQERLWFLDQLDPGGCAYNVGELLRWTGPLDMAALQRSLDEIVRRHEVLRTRLRGVNGQPQPAVSPAEPVLLPVVDLSGSPGAKREEEAALLAREEARRPFDLAADPMLRATLLRLGPEEHRLVLTLHHAATDGWSVGVIYRELAALYAAFARGERPPGEETLPDLPAQYTGFADWQRRWLEGAAARRELEYWMRQLAGGPPVLDLPTDRPRPQVSSGLGATRSFLLPPGLTTALGDLGREEGATLYMVLLAAFQALLHRWTGQEDFVIGSPVAGRCRVETEPLVGFFVNTLLLRGDLSTNPAFRELLRRTRDTALGAFAHQDLPFERLVEVLKPERSGNRQPLFQVMFALQNAPLGDNAPPGVTWRREEIDKGTALFDLTLVAEETAAGLACAFNYSTDLFEPATLDRLAGQFQRLIEGIVAAPDCRLGDLPLLAPVERATLLDEWNRTEAAFPEDRLVQDLFEEHAARDPGALAVAAGERRLTYGALNQQADALAASLRTFGVGPETRVAVCLPRSPEWVTALLAVLKAGGAYVPLDPNDPPGRLRFMLDDAHAPVLLTLRRFAGAFPDCAARVVLLDELDANAATPPAPRLPPPAPGPSPLAYVIYTSGSTGRPRGVEIEHRSLANLCAWHQREYRVTPADRATLVASPAFDASVWELWPYLTAGASVHIPDDDTRGSPENLMEWLAAERITLSFLPTPLAEAVVEAPLAKDLRLRALLTGGDRFRRAPSRPLPFALINHYGPTENTVVTTCAPIASSEGGAPPIGRPIANTQAYVLDARLQPVPMGVVGELCVSGAGLARGYLGLPALTAEKFVPHPFLSQPGARLYRTGDRARWRADGRLEFLGRLDQQVKVRGFRVELAEIEAALLAHPAVREAAVMAREDERGEKRLAGYVSLKDGAVPDEADLGAFLRRTLPEHMVPPVFVPLASLPRLPGGKLDRAALPPPAVTGGQESGVAPRDETEERLASIWRDLLGVPRVGAFDHFFELGGHSLLATQMASRVRSAFGSELPLQTVFARPRLADLAEAIRGRKAPAVPPPALAPIRSIARQGEFPLSSAQERLWFFDQLAPGNPAYNVPAAVRIAGRLDPAALQAAFDEIARRHESLRTTFRLVNDVPVQVVAAAGAGRIEFTDLQGTSLELDPLLVEEARRPFDLTAGPLLRVRLFRLADTEHVLAWTTHHIISDGWSHGLLLGELARLYEAFAAGQASPLPELRIQYPDYAQWQRQWLEGGAFPRQLEYWKRKLAGSAPVLELPADRPRPPVQSFRGGSHSFPLPHALAEGLRALGQGEGATLFMTLLAGFHALLHRYTGQEDLLVGTPIANRNREEVEGLIGLLANTLVLRADVSGNPGFRELLRRVRLTATEAYDRQDLPIDKLVEALNPERDLSHQPLFQVMFVLQNAPAGPLRLPGLTLAPVEVDTHTALYDLTLFVEEGPEGLRGTLEYNTDLFDAATAERMARHYVRLLEGAVARPDERLGELPWMDEVERRQVIEEWNRTRTDYPRDRAIHELFEEQAARRPDAVALERGDARMTYGELNARADRLARHLRGLGVGPETLVCVCLERSFDLIAALLGVLKAGGAYVPLDPASPKDRLAFMLEDTQARTLLTHSALGTALPLDTMAGARPRVVRVDELETGTNPPTPATPAPDGSRVKATSLAYVLYTSGSTGQPKGVCVPHRGVVRLVKGADYAVFDESETFLLHSPASFDASTLEIWAPLLNGGRLALLEPGGGTLDDMARAIARHQVTTLWLTADLFRLVIEERPEALAGVRQLLAGGDVLPVAQVNAALAGGRFKLINGYGPTENTTFSCCHVMAPGATCDGPVPIGRPIANTRAYVLDARLQPVPVGVPGELCVAGDGLARGYWNRPGLTAEKFVPDPFSNEPGATLYRTGDLARWRPDGALEFLGRRDRQVKVRGFRIELAEIEAVLARHPKVRRALVVPRTDQSGAKQLAAYVVPAAGATPEAGELRGFLATRLPEPMMPSFFVALESLPVSPGGKVDWRALPEAGPERDPAGAAPQEPRDLLEVQLKQIWENVLGMRPVGVQDNFFELGGHSLMAVKLFAQIEKALGVHLPLATMFQAPTIDRLAAVLRHDGWQPPWSSLVPIKPGGTRPPFYIIHGLGGNVLNFHGLAQHLGEDQPVYGLQSQGLDGRSALPTSIEDMAAHYIREVRAFQPRGPYHLGGMSFGGVVAWEMAQQLHAQGERVATLTLLDSFPLGYSELIPITQRTRRSAELWRRRFRLHSRNLLALPARAKWDYLRKKLGTLRRRWRSRLWQWRSRLHRTRGREMPDALQNVKEANFLAARDYVTRPYPGRVTLFVASEQPLEGYYDLQLVWGQLARGGVETLQVPGDHTTVIVEPNVRVLAGKLKDCLARGQAGAA